MLLVVLKCFKYYTSLYYSYYVTCILLILDAYGSFKKIAVFLFLLYCSVKLFDTPL